VSSFRVERGVLVSIYADAGRIAEQCRDMVGGMVRGESSCREIGARAPREARVIWSDGVAAQLGIARPAHAGIDEVMP
jgi:hypothetical protein